MITTRITSIFAAAALVAGASVPAFAAEDKPAPTIEKPVAKANRYCVTQVTTGTMLRKARVCKTRDQWIAQDGVDPLRK